MSNNVCYKLVKLIVISFLLSPHPFTQIAIKHGAVCPVLLFVSEFGVLPRILHALCVSSRNWVKEFIIIVES